MKFRLTMILFDWSPLVVVQMLQILENNPQRLDNISLTEKKIGEKTFSKLLTDKLMG